MPLDLFGDNKNQPQDLFADVTAEKTPAMGSDYIPSNPEQDTNLTWKQALIEGFQNIPSSAWGYGKNIASAVVHPIETGKNIGKMAAGFGQKIVPGEQEYEKYADAAIDMMKNRYGSVEKFKKTLAEDPVGIAADLSTLLSGGGAAVRGAAIAGKLSKVGSVASAVSKVGMAAEPLNIARGIAALPLKLVPESLPIKWYQSAVKFGTTLSAKEREAVTRTALSAKNQIMPTSKGMEKLRGMIDDYNSEVSNIINESTNSGQKISVNRLFNGLKNLKDQFKRMSDEPSKWDSAFESRKKEWIKMLEIGPNRTPAEVQQLKINIYKDLESFYEKHKATPAKVELRKAIARNARESLERIIPEIKQLNKEEGALIELWDAIESKANRISNRDLIGIGLPVKMGTGSGIGYMFGGTQGGAIGSSLGFALGIFDTPQVKAKIALVLSRLKEKGITLNPTIVGTRLGLYETERVRNEED